MSWTINPEYPPHTIGMACFVCGSDLRNRTLNRRDGHEQALSTGRFIEFEGLVVVCETCIKEAAGMIGMIPAEKVEELRKNNRELGRQNGVYRADLEKAKAVIQSLNDLFPKGKK